MDAAPQQVRWHPFDSEAEFVHEALEFILDAAGSAITARGTFLIVLAGGNTPRKLYRQLRDVQTDWSAWHVYFGDERCTAPDDPARNSRMAMDEWLAHVPIPKTQIHPIPAEQGPEAAAQAYAQELAQIETFDVVLLGLGEDGHTASLFPGGTWEGTIELPSVIPVHNAPKHPPDRVSLSPRRLEQAREVIYLVQGADKRVQVSKWRAGDTLPASMIRPPSGVDVFLHL